MPIDGASHWSVVVSQSLAMNEGGRHHILSIIAAKMDTS